MQEAFNSELLKIILPCNMSLRDLWEALMEGTVGTHALIAEGAVLNGIRMMIPLKEPVDSSL
jgi:hypothetical protein